MLDIRMLDGRIDMHGTVAALREHGILEAIEQESGVQVVEEENAVAEEMGIGEKTAEEEAVEGAVEVDEDKDGGAEGEVVKKARPLRTHSLVLDRPRALLPRPPSDH